MNEKNLGQKCSRCDGFMEQFRRGHNPICQKCQTIASRKNSALRSLKLKGIIVDTNWSSWVCGCYHGQGFIHSINDYGCFTCLERNPIFKK